MWESLAKPAKRVKVGSVVLFGDGLLRAVCVGVGEEGIRTFRFAYRGVFLELLERLGEMPLPPYIHEKLVDRDRYQTVYSRVVGSAAAPTAGLHFTPALLDAIRARGVIVTAITLHVGLGTFRPVAVEDVATHKMHSEFYTVSATTASVLAAARAEGRRIIAVGTTTTRTLETILAKHGGFVAAAGWTDIFIYPGFTYRAIDGLITNFHLPKSTLIMLVAAFASQEIILNAYAAAIAAKYRFFSFGDAMFIQPNKR